MEQEDRPSVRICESTRLLLTVLLFFDTILTRAGLTERSGSTLGGEVPAIFIGGPMKELSIFIDESGDFGPYAKHSPYYLVTMVFHDQRKSIDHAVQVLRENPVRRK